MCEAESFFIFLGVVLKSIPRCFVLLVILCNKIQVQILQHSDQLLFTYYLSLLLDGRNIFSNREVGYYFKMLGNI